MLDLTICPDLGEIEKSLFIFLKSIIHFDFSCFIHDILSLFFLFLALWLEVKSKMLSSTNDTGKI